MKQKDILLLIISSFALIVFWVIFNIYHSFATSTISPTLSVAISPINPTFDKKVITNLELRKKVSPIYSPLATGSAVQVPTIPVASKSALIQNTSTQSAATSGGTLK